MRLHTRLATNDAPELFNALAKRVHAFLKEYSIQRHIRFTRTERFHDVFLQKAATAYHHQIELMFAGKTTVVHYSTYDTEHFSTAHMLTEHAKSIYECEIRIASFEDFCNTYGANFNSEEDAIYYRKICWLAGQYKHLFPEEIYTAFSHLVEDLYESDKEGG